MKRGKKKGRKGKKEKKGRRKRGEMDMLQNHLRRTLLDSGGIIFPTSAALELQTFFKLPC